ncbi:MAG: tetratricopeptide repeat protein [Verrucomicrobiota bacterium]
MKTPAPLLISCLCFLVCATGFAAPVTPINEADTAENNLPAQYLLRSNLQLQDQLHSALQAIERARVDAESSSKRNADFFSERLASVERNLAQQREHDLETMVSMRESNRLALVAAVAVAGIGMLCLLFAAWFQVRAMNRMSLMGSLAAPGSHSEQGRMLGETLPSVPTRLSGTDQVTARFLSAIDQLERRIHDLDSLNVTAVESARASAQKPHSDWKPSSRPAITSETVSQVRSLLVEGQSALNSNDADGALLCFERALEMDPNSAEALVKKGTALEAQRKLHEAIESYDRAIVMDSSLTVAYLYKGGALNRLQRFSEAMACYEMALRNHPKKAA